MNPPDKKEEVMDWPLLYAERASDGPEIRTFKYPEALLKGRQHQAYHPESSPNVLTPEEAQLLIGALDEVDFEHWEPLGELEKRLKDWAEEEGH